MKPLCFVLMPFGDKLDATGRVIPFDRIYAEGIGPGIRDADMEPIRADHERTGGLIHRAMFERLMLCNFAVADLTTANANVYYELGIRHAVRPRTTLPIFASHQSIPFDLNLVRAMPYTLGPANAFSTELAGALRADLAARLRALAEAARSDAGAADSPVFELLRDYRPADISRLRSDVFRDRAAYAEQLKIRLAEARSAGDDTALDAVRQELGSIDITQAGAAVDLLLSYRALKRWGRMVTLFEDLPDELQRTVLVRQQLAFALNRRAGPGERARAARVLEELLAEHGGSSETYGLLGRISKDRWEAAKESAPTQARGHLRRAIDHYRLGLEADPRDAYPGVNLVTLLEVSGTPAALAEQRRVIGVVRYAAERRLAAPGTDYWDHATLLELAVLANDQKAAQRHLEDALAAVREPWEPETTARNLRLIADGREPRGEDVTWIRALVAALG